MKKIKYKKVSYDKLFFFSSLGWKVQGSISGNIRKAFFWENIGKVFYWENIFFLILHWKVPFPEIKSFFSGWIFLGFFGLWLSLCGVPFPEI